jgi:hypothetical protein
MSNNEKNIQTSSVVTKYRVRYSCVAITNGWPRIPAQSVDVETPLEDVPSRLPPNSEVMSIENLATGELVHWTRWPASYRPGAGSTNSEGELLRERTPTEPSEEKRHAE